jgi:hypothetical protein
MASVINSLAPQAKADGQLEEKSYVKMAVFKVIGLVNAIFAKMGEFFFSLSSFFVRQKKNDIPNENPVNNPVEAPAEIPLIDRKWESFKTYLSPEEILDLFYSEKISSADRDALYLKVAQAKRMSTCSLLRILTKVVLGDSKEQQLYEGKKAIQENPNLIVSFLRTKI